MTAQLLRTALSRLEEAALEPHRWPAALTALGAAFDAKIFAMLRLNDDGAEILLPDHSPDHAALYENGGWYDRDPRGRRALTFRPNRITIDDELLSEGERDTADFYRDFAAKEDVPYIASWRVDAGSAPIFFSAMRSAAVGPASLGDRRKLAAVREHANAAALLSSGLERAHSKGLMDGFELAGKAVIALDRKGKAIAATSLGAALLSRHFSERDGRLSSGDPAADTEIKRALATRSGSAARSFLLPAQGGRGALCTPIRNLGDNPIFSEVGLVLHLRDLDAKDGPAKTDILEAAFGLTPAEAEIARLIAAGWAPDAIARERGSAVATVRTILAAVFRKTGVARQAELAHLLNQLA